MKRPAVLLAVILLLAPAVTVSACPMCKDSIPSSDAQATESLPGGFNSSVYYMLGGLFAAIGVAGFNLWRGTRR